MRILRRAIDRRHDRRRKHEIWLTFEPSHRGDSLAEGFGTLRTLREDLVPPNTGVPRHPHGYAEVITYVRDGALAWADSTGQSGVMNAGEFRRATAVRRVRQSETNASRTDWAHFFQMALRPSEADLEATPEQKRFGTAERRGRLCVVASRDGRHGSLRIKQDALIHSALLGIGKHVVHELAPGRCAWLQVVAGEVSLGDVVMTTGDGAGIAAERAVSLTAREESEILLFDLGEWRGPEHAAIN